MRIVDFDASLAGRAELVALQNYRAERERVPLLPEVARVPALAEYAANGLGAAALEGDRLLGFLCAEGPFENAFRSTGAAGVFSPMGAHGALYAEGVDRARVYARLYEAAGAKWARAGAASHAVCLYAHDEAALKQFFRYGFGLRCVDALREMEPLAAAEGYEYFELIESELPRVYGLEELLCEHLARSPCFIRRRQRSAGELLAEARGEGVRYFAAALGGEIAAFVSASARGGETFVCETPGFFSVCHAYCLPGHRGGGAFAGLLGAMASILKSENYTRLGVNFESINPPAWGFWNKHFEAYTHSVVRRVDERAVGE